MPGQLAGITLLLVGFLIGAIPWGYFAGRLALGIDLRSVGSGGTGATNVLRTLGARASIAVAVLDVLKGVLPVAIARFAHFDPPWTAAAGVVAVVGHCWSPFIGFKGGKGVATGAGAAMALFPQVLLVLPMMALIVWRTRFVSLGSLVAAWLAVLLAFAFAAAGQLDWPSAIAILAISAIITLRHEGNIRRLLAGTERRLRRNHFRRAWVTASHLHIHSETSAARTKPSKPFHRASSDMASSPKFRGPWSNLPRDWWDRQDGARSRPPALKYR